MRSPQFRIACCLCGKPIPLASDVYALDQEWRRRFPQMVGTLACRRCALDRNQWKCQNADGTYVAGHHQPAARGDEDRDFDSWSHIAAEETHRAMVTTHPWSGLVQGAEEYLRHLASRPGVDLAVAARLRHALDEWDARAVAGSPRT
ncbi:hypothetical protein AB0M46_23435 [Dactylosporangium sp. NPDC051485]|uniref:hypothetical protein n=1 Tax=Dactylosporangium sp. NPDC051485 TaxID=3154846 RepID=UPI00344AB32F